MAYNPLAGKDAIVQVGAIEYCFKVADVDIQMKLGDVTNFCSAGAQLVINGPYKAKITLSGPLDAEGNMAFEVGTLYIITILYSATTKYIIQTMCESIKVTADVMEPDMCEVVFQSQGPFTPAFPSATGV